MSLLPVADIDTGERYRKDMGDLPALAASIDAVGLLHPIVVMGKPEGGRPTLADDLRLELEARTAEERNASAKAAPIIYLARRSRDPQVMAAALVVAEAFIVRHQRRWTGGDAA